MWLSGSYVLFDKGAHVALLLQQRPMLWLALPALTGSVLATTRIGRWVICVFIAALLLWKISQLRKASRRRQPRCHRQPRQPGIASCHGKTGRPDRIALATLCLFLLGSLRLGVPYAMAEKFNREQANHQWSGTGVVVARLSEYTTSRGKAKVNAVIRIENGVRIAVTGTPEIFKPGNQVNLTGYLVRPDPAVNPGGFDQRDWLWRQGIFLSLEQSDETKYSLVKPALANPIAVAAESARESLQSFIDQLVGSEQAALLFGLMVGDASGLNKEQEYHFRQAGLSHLTAVSGANIAFWLTPLTLILRRSHLRRKIRQVLLLIVLIAFGFLTGWQVSVTRAIIMSAIFLIGRLAHRRSDPLNGLGWVILIFIAFAPFAILSFGFWLSLLATVGLLSASPLLIQRISHRWPNLPQPISELISLNLSVQLLVLPVSLILSHQLSFVGLIANIPAVMIVEWLTAISFVSIILYYFIRLLTFLFFTSTMFLMSPVGLEKPGSLMVGWLLLPGRPIAGALTILEQLAEYFSRWDYGRWPASRLNLFLIAGLLILSIGLFRTRGGLLRHWVNRLTVIGFAAGLLFAQISPVLWPRDQIWFLSVGQGDATLIMTRSGQTVLIDSGPPNSGWNIVLPALDALGLRRIDLLIVTHGHSDHAGGVSDLLQSGRIDRLYWPKFVFQEKRTIVSRDDLTSQIVKIAANEGVEMHALHKNDTIRLNSGQDYLQVLSQDDVSDPDDQNEQALHFLLQIEGQRILLMSDCTPGIEAALLADTLTGPVQILKVAHHGSRATTRQTLLKTVQPKLAVISVGYNNYGHPAPELLDRLRSLSIRTLRTDRQGAIQTTIRNGQCFTETYRKDRYG